MDGIRPDSAETLELLEHYRSGDHSGLERLFARHRPLLRQYVELRLDARIRRKVDPSDIVQETQMEALRRLHDYLHRRPTSFSLWLRKTAYERVIMAHRRYFGAAGRDVSREVSLPERSSLLLAGRLMSRDASPSHGASRRELAHKVRLAVSRLPEADREIVLMHTIEGLSYAEAGYLLGVKPETAKKRHGRALIRLHKLLLDDGFEESAT